MRATQLLWEAAGRPDPRKKVIEATGRCYWCGRPVERACRAQDVCGSNWTDHDVSTVPLSPWVCQACTWSLTGKPPDTLRLWSLVYREDRDAAPSHEKAMTLGPRIHLQNKADVREFDAVLRDPPEGRWVCAVTDSGKIHVVPFAVANYGRHRWRVRFERFDVRATPDEYARIADAQQALYDAGFSKDEIATGEPNVSKVCRFGIDRWRSHDQILRPYRGGPLFELSLFLRRKTDGDGNG